MGLLVGMIISEVDNVSFEDDLQEIIKMRNLFVVSDAPSISSFITIKVFFVVQCLIPDEHIIEHENFFLDLEKLLTGCQHF